MLHGLYWLLNNLADGAPIVLAVDDLQWSDTESLRFLNYLAPRLDGLRSSSWQRRAAGSGRPTWPGWRPALKQWCCDRHR